MLASARPRAPAPTVGQRALSVVAVDGNPMDLAQLMTLIRKAIPDASVEAAGSGSQGLAAIHESSPQFVIADIQLRNMNGIEMIRALRRSLRFAQER